MDFDPTKIEKLKPVSLRLWLEKVLPGILVRDIKFWLSPVSVKIGPFSLKLGIPIGIKPVTETIYEFQEGIPEQAISVMNEYLYDALDKFVRELYKAYTDATDQFVKEWKICLKDYLERIGAAKHLTSEESQEKINSFIKHLRNSHQEVSTLISQD